MNIKKLISILAIVLAPIFLRAQLTVHDEIVFAEAHTLRVTAIALAIINHPTFRLEFSELWKVVQVHRQDLELRFLSHDIVKWDTTKELERRAGINAKSVARFLLQIHGLNIRRMGPLEAEPYRNFINNFNGKESEYRDQDARSMALFDFLVDEAKFFEVLHVLGLIEHIADLLDRALYEKLDHVAKPAVTEFGLQTKLPSVFLLEDAYSKFSVGERHMLLRLARFAEKHLNYPLIVAGYEMHNYEIHRKGTSLKEVYAKFRDQRIRLVNNSSHHIHRPYRGYFHEIQKELNMFTGNSCRRLQFL